MERKRFYLIDGIRGIAVISMVIYHFVWDLYNVAGIGWGSHSSLGNLLWQQSICWTFILVCGFCYYGSRHPLKNGIITLLCGIAVTVATVIAAPRSAIYFGVLIFHSSAMLLILPLRRLLYKVPPVAGAAVSFLLFVLSYGVNSGSVCFGLITLPRFLYKNMFTTFWGFPEAGFFSADYFSFFPWIFLFLVGFFAAGILKRRGSVPELLYFRLGFFEWIGRRALIIYMAHQPILYGLTVLITYVL